MKIMEIQSYTTKIETCKEFKVFPIEEIEKFFERTNGTLQRLMNFQNEGLKNL